jgi:hypothetical protein
VKPARPDPRLFQKNFAMPMNPASVGEAELPPTRRKDGAAVAAPAIPAYGPPWTPPSEIRNREANDLPPLYCSLFRKPDGSRAVTVTEGRVIEVIPKSDDGGGGLVDGVKEWEIEQIWDGSLLKEHGIESGQVVGIAYNVDERGYLTGKPRVSVRTTAAGEKSTHYQPPVGPSPGAAGDVFVILARLTGSGNSERLEVYHGGSNIEHVHDLAPFKMTAGATGQNIFKVYNMTAGQYEYLGIKGLEPVVVTTVGDDIQIALREGDGNLDLVVRTMTFNAGTPTTVRIDLPALPFSGTTGAGTSHTHTLSGGATNVVADHSHALGTNTEYAGSPDVHYHTIDSTTDPAGGHSHTVSATVVGESAHTHPFSGFTQAVNATTNPNLRPSITVPGTPSFTLDSSYFTICFRNRGFHSVVADGGALPPHTGSKTTKTIYTLAPPPA